LRLKERNKLIWGATKIKITHLACTWCSFSLSALAEASMSFQKVHGDDKKKIR